MSECLFYKPNKGNRRDNFDDHVTLIIKNIYILQNPAIIKHLVFLYLVILVETILVGSKSSRGEKEDIHV